MVISAEFEIGWLRSDYGFPVPNWEPLLGKVELNEAQLKKIDRDAFEWVGVPSDYWLELVA